MKHLIRIGLWIASAALLLSAAWPGGVARAQVGGLTAVIEAVVTTAHPALTAYLTVRDANGVPVTGLGLESFALFEDHAAQPAALRTLATRVNADTGIWVVLAIDVSGSMAGQPLADAKSAATRFLDVMTPQDHVAVYAFQREVDLDQADPAREVAFTSDRTPLYAFIDGLQADGQTPLYDAAYKAVLMLDVAPADEPRSIVLFTDGRDEGSQVAGADTAATEAQRRGIPVFTIGLAQADEDFIRELARRTGGSYQSAADSAALGELFLGVAQTLKTQYVLIYDSALPPDGQEHWLTVQVTLSGGAASAERRIGPLPFVPTATNTPLPSSTPTPSATPQPPPSPTPAPSATVAAVAIQPRAPSAPAAAWPGPLGWLIAAGVALVGAGGAAWVLARRRARPTPHQCSFCGYVGEYVQPCPACGRTGTLKPVRTP